MLILCSLLRVQAFRCSSISTRNDVLRNRVKFTTDSTARWASTALVSPSVTIKNSRNSTGVTAGQTMTSHSSTTFESNVLRNQTISDHPTLQIARDSDVSLLTSLTGNEDRTVVDAEDSIGATTTGLSRQDLQRQKRIRKLLQKHRKRRREAAAIAAIQASDAVFPTVTTPPVDRDAMIARAAVLRQSILKQQMELQQLERQIICCANAPSVAPPANSGVTTTTVVSPVASSTLVASDIAKTASTSASVITKTSTASSNKREKKSDSTSSTHVAIVAEVPQGPLDYLGYTARQSRQTFLNSCNVLLRKLQRVKGQVGVNNKQYGGSLPKYIGTQTATGLRILQDLVFKNPTKTVQQLLRDPQSPTLIPHIPSIYARLDRLEQHVDPILEKVLNNKQHLASIEPYFDEIMERFDDIEPHLPWILKNIDVLAPYTGLLLKHIDELLLYAEDDEKDGRERYELAQQLLPYLEFYVSRLDVVGPHLPLLRPHLPKLLKHDRIAKITPHIDRLFARGFLNLGTSANLDVLLFWVGWTLRIPFLPRVFFAIPGSPRFVTFLANRLPKRFVRGYCSDVQCSVDGDYGTSWNRLSKD